MIESPHRVTISYSHDSIVESITGIWNPTQCERTAAWDMYVELITRIPVAYVKPGEGSLRIGLSSLYKLFDASREILRQYGPSVARPRDEGELSFSYLSIKVLDLVLRPFMMKWHPLLAEYESTRSRADSQLDHERKWERYRDLELAMKEVREALMQYARLLAMASEVPELIEKGDQA
jgi:hypothetical protein